MAKSSKKDLPSLEAAEAFLRRFLSIRTRDRRAFALRRFGRFAAFMGLTTEEGAPAVSRLLCHRSHQAIRILARYDRWFRKQGRAGKNRGIRNTGLTVLTKAAEKEGLTRWHYAGRRKEDLETDLPKASAALLRDWRRTLETSNYSSSNISNRVRRIQQFMRYLGSRRRSYRGISQKLLEVWKKDGHRRGLSPRTLGSYLAEIRSFYRWLVERGCLKRNPVEIVDRIKVPRPPVAALGEKEVRTLLDGARHPRDRALFELLYATGCRQGEIVGLNLEDLSFDRRRIRCLGKGRRERFVFFGRQALRAIRDFLPWRMALLVRRHREDEKALFITQGGTRITAAVVQNRLSEIAKISLPGRRVYPHLLRHSFATHLLNRGASMKAVQALLGHKYASTTAWYGRLSFLRLRKVYDATHPWSGWEKGP